MEREFQGTLNWFSNPSSQVSAHIVIAADGTVANVVDTDLTAWHAGSHNGAYLGVELVQPRQGDPITQAQYRALGWWLKRMSTKYAFPLVKGRLPEHRETSQGQSMGKSDIGPPFSFEALQAFL